MTLEVYSWYHYLTFLMHQTLEKTAGDGFTFCTFSGNSTRILSFFLSLLAFYHSAMNFKYSDFNPSRLRYRHKRYRHGCYQKFWIHNNDSLKTFGQIVTKHKLKIRSKTLPTCQILYKKLSWPFKRQPHKMVKHTQTIHRLLRCYTKSC